MDVCRPTHSYRWWQTPSKLKGENAEWNSRSTLNLLKFKVIYGTVHRIPAVIIEHHVFFRTHAAFCPRKALTFLLFFIFLSAIWWLFEREKHITHTADSLESRSHSPLLTQTWTPKDNELLTEEASKSKCLLKKIPICVPITVMQTLRFLTAWKCPYILHLTQEREHYLSQRRPFIRLPSSWFLTL